MMISTKGRYALMIMVYIAQHAKDSPVSLKEIAKNKNMGIKYLEVITALLTKAGLLDSCRGKNGGYRLNRPPEEYTILSIIRASEGELLPVACVEDGFCANAPNCKTRQMWKSLDDLVKDYLSSKTLADII